MDSALSLPESEASIRAWLIQYLAGLLEMDPDEIDVDTPVAAYGLDSSGAVGMTGDLGQFLGRKLEPEITYRYTTIHTLAQYLAGGE